MQDITGVQVVEVSGDKTRNGKDRYTITLSNGTSHSCFELAQANKAQSLRGQVVDVRLKPSKDGKYLNFEDVAPAGQLPPLPFAPGTPIAFGNTPAGVPLGSPIGQTETPIIAAPIPFIDRDAEKNERIGKMNAAGTAFNFVGNFYQGAGPEALEDAIEKAWGIAAQIYTKVQPGAVGNDSVKDDLATQQVREVLFSEKVPAATGGPIW